MKAIYVFFTCISILFAVGCSDRNVHEDVETTADAPVVDPAQKSAFNDLSWPITLDSFSSSFTRVKPGSFSTKNTPANKLSLSREKDSITLSGAFYIAYQNGQKHAAYHSYHFYLRTGLHSLEAFFKTDRFENDVDDQGKLQKVAVAEKGYHLNWGRKA